MTTKILISIPLFLIFTNLYYLIDNGLYMEFSHENILLIVNSVFMLIFLCVYYYQTKYQSSQENDIDANSIYALTNIQANEFQISTQALVEYFPDILCIKDNNGRWLAASQFYLKIFDLHDVNYIGKTDAELFNYAGSPNVELLKVSFIQDKSSWHLAQATKETKTVIIDRKKKTLEIIRIPIFDHQKNALKLIITGGFVDIDDKRRNELLEVMPKTFDICHLNLFYLNKNFQIIEVNTALTLFTEYSASELIGKPLSFIVKGKLAHLQTEFFSSNNRQVWSAELKCLTKIGRDYSVKLEISAITKGNNEVIYFGSLLDITQQKQAEKRIIKLSNYDELTGLANRTMFYEKLKKFISSAIQTPHAHATILVIDLDRFKIINESLGHDAGNQLLKVVAQRLQDLIGANDIAARLSGDEFAILMLTDQTYEQTVYTISILAGKISHRLSEVIHIDDHEALIGSSIGISIYPEDCRDVDIPLKAETLLKNADIARNNAKIQGKNSYQFYNKNYNTTPQNKLTMELNLRKAITKNELKLYFQPQYNIIEKRVSGAEVLIRWFHNNEKMVPPDHFISLAEDTGLIIEIGQWILINSCQQLKKWLDAGLILPQVSVNVSAHQFSDSNFLHLVEQALASCNLEPEHLELEITESMLIGDTRFIDFQLQNLKKMGIKLALDDFGTGYSSLSYLKNFPIDILKMDQSFVKGMTIDSKNARIASAIIEIGHSLKQLVIAEGVETKNQFDFLRKRGCDIIQGYFLSKPLSVEEMTEFLKTADELTMRITKNDPFE